MVTTSTTSAVLINVGYVKTVPGILKILEIILGCVICGLIGHYITSSNYRTPEQLQSQLPILITAAACLITTTLLFFSCLFSISTGAIIPKTLFETLYHAIASILYFSVSVYFLVYLMDNKRYVPFYNPKIAAAAIGLVNTALYVLSCIYSIRSFRRG